MTSAKDHFSKEKKNIFKIHNFRWPIYYSKTGLGNRHFRQPESGWPDFNSARLIKFKKALEIVVFEDAAKQLFFRM